MCEKCSAACYNVVGNQHVCPGDIGQCIDQSQLCDDVEDCPNGEDEHFSTYCPLKGMLT